MFRIRKLGRLHLHHPVTLNMGQNPAGIDPAVGRANGADLYEFFLLSCYFIPLNIYFWRRYLFEVGSRTRRRPKRTGLCRSKHAEVGKKDCIYLMFTVIRRFLLIPHHPLSRHHYRGYKPLHVLILLFSAFCTPTFSTSQLLIFFLFPTSESAIVIRTSAFRLPDFPTSHSDFPLQKLPTSAICRLPTSSPSHLLFSDFRPPTSDLNFFRLLTSRASHFRQLPTSCPSHLCLLTSAFRLPTSIFSDFRLPTFPILRTDTSHPIYFDIFLRSTADIPIPPAAKHKVRRLSGRDRNPPFSIQFF